MPFTISNQKKWPPAISMRVFAATFSFMGPGMHPRHVSPSHIPHPAGSIVLARAHAWRARMHSRDYGKHVLINSMVTGTFSLLQTGVLSWKDMLQMFPSTTSTQWAMAFSFSESFRQLLQAAASW